MKCRVMVRITCWDSWDYEVNNPEDTLTFVKGAIQSKYRDRLIKSEIIKVTKFVDGEWRDLIYSISDHCFMLDNLKK